MAAALQADRAAEVRCREIGDRLATARVMAAKTFTETPASAGSRFTSPKEFWLARRTLPDLEREFEAAQLEREETRAALSEARRVARVALSSQVVERLVPRARETVRALEALRPVLATLEAEAREAAGISGVARAPLGAVNLVTMAIRACEHSLTDWLTPPTPRPLPTGHVLVTCRKQFSILPDGTLERNDRGQTINVGHPFAAGAKPLVGERCAVAPEAAEVLIAGGFVERVV